MRKIRYKIKQIKSRNKTKQRKKITTKEYKETKTIDKEVIQQNEKQKKTER